uniref:Carboxypeptidase n=1 Tax=Octactis speculum TaxID=3111310 RepID=A0A7S2MJV0_9STRA
MHVILRTRLERDIVNGVISVKDLPRLWNEGMKSLLDVDVPNDAQGCLQDVHWSGLAIGYFPTYLIGAIAAAQLEHEIRKDLNFEGLCETGDFAPIQKWLKEKVHIHGSGYDSLDDLFLDQFGEKLNCKYFLEYLAVKYEMIYNIS